ncbi:hypothetical protein HDU76_007944 [Blyttiomyces sp. JEL0837]|nr:hypothetical protein HDU76_007944 [Blyttiomyces sp. JEL0837]
MQFIVVGSGTFGLSTAYALRLRGHDVTVFDRLEIPAQDAASTDINKVVRPDYASEILYQKLALDSIARFKVWNADALKRYGRPLYYECGVAYLTATEAMNDFEVESLKELKEVGYGEKMELVTAEVTKEKWPGLASCADTLKGGYINHGAGFGDSGLTIRYLHDIAKEIGVKFITGPKAGYFRSFLNTDPTNPTAVTGIKTADKKSHFGKVIVAAGSWTPSLLPELAEFCVPTGQPVVQFKIPESLKEKYNWSKFPVWFADVSRSGFYGFPMNFEGIMKVANHGGGFESSGDKGFHKPGEAVKITPKDIPREAVVTYRKFFEYAFPDLNKLDIKATRLCWYCESWDSNFYIDAVPNRKGLYVASGGSGHGFKFTPCLGEVVADIIEGKPTPFRSLFQWRPKPASDARVQDSIRGESETKKLEDQLMADADDLTADAYKSGRLFKKPTVRGAASKL